MLFEVGLSFDRGNNLVALPVFTLFLGIVCVVYMVQTLGYNLFNFTKADTSSFLQAFSSCDGLDRYFLMLWEESGIWKNLLCPFLLF